ncbi:MAG: aldo/keto reductase [Asgard group archaeon]|nr:aldo/keto reductase [Asgard group archaeon]
MSTRIFGKSKIKVSSVGMGCFPIGGLFYHGGKIHSHGHVDEKIALDSIKKGLDLGITLFDTADVYGCGRSEKILGEALKGRREEVVIATKFASLWNFESGDPKTPCLSTGEKDITPEYIKRACLNSLKRLQTDYIDIFQLHWSDMALEKIDNIRDTLEELVSDGYIRSYGWSTDSVSRAKTLAEGEHCSSFQFSINFTRENPKMLQLLSDNQLGGLIRSPFGMGILLGKYNEESKVSKDHYLHRLNFKDEKMVQTFSKLDDLKQLIANSGRTLAQIVIGYILAKHESIVPIPGFKNPSQVEENAKAIEMGPLSQKLVKEIDELFSELRVDMGFAY